MNITESQLNYDNESTSEKEKSTELKDFSSNSNAIKVIMEILTELSSKMDESNMTLDRIVRKFLPKEDILAWPKDMPPLPLKTLNALDQMEDFLESNVNFSCMANYLAGRIWQFGDINLAIHSISVKIISNNLVRCISWKGTLDSKIAFESTRLCEVIQCVVLKKFGQAESEALKHLKRCLNTSAQKF